MSYRAPAWLAWSLAGISFAMFLTTVAFSVRARSVQSLGDRVTIAAVSDLLIFVPFLAFPFVGALIASRRPHNPIGWICLADGFLWMLLGVTESYSAYGVARPGLVPFPVAIYALGEWLWVPAAGLFATYLILLFPDGKLPSRRWRPLAWLSGVVIVLLSVSVGLAPGPLEGLGRVRNPFGLEEHPWVADVFYVVLPLLPLCILASAFSLVLRYRRSGGEEREQIKWIAFAASVVGLLFLISIVIMLIYAFEPPLWTKPLDSVGVLSFGGVPIAIGFAVLKYRLYDIEVIINRTLVYGSLTASLAFVYFGVWR